MKKLFGFLFILFINSNCVLQAQWVKTNGPYGCSVNSLIGSGSTLFMNTWVTTVNSNYYSTNNGTSWNQVDSSLSGGINCVVNIGTNLFAGTTNGVFLSTNNGATWVSVSTGLPQFVKVNTLAVIGTNLFAGMGEVSGGGYAGDIFISTNYGKSWTLLNSWGSVNSLAIVGTKLFVGAGDYMYDMGLGAGGLFYSTDNGISWTNSGLPGACLDNSLFVIGANIYVIMTTYSEDHGYGWAYYLSTDNGNSWTKQSSTIMPRSFGSNGNGGTNLYGLNQGVFLSTNNGNSWTSIGLNKVNVSSLMAIGTNLFAGTVDGVLLSTNFGGKWIPVNQGINHANINCLASNDANQLAAASQNFIYLSSDNGANWTPTNSPNNGTYFNRLAFSGSDLFASTAFGALFVTTDKGNSWKQIFGNENDNRGDTSIIAFCIDDKKLIVSIQYQPINFANQSQLISYTNNGSSWISAGLENKNIKVLGSNESYLFGTNGFWEGDSSIFISSNNGLNWNNLGAPSNPSFVPTCLAISGSNLIAGTYGGSGIFLSPINSPNWSFSGLQYEDIQCLAVSDNNVFAGTESDGVFLSSNNGTNWTQVNNGLTNNYISSLEISSKNIFASTMDGIWRRPLSELTSVKSSSLISPTSFTLEQNYPNPFNPTTTINYSVPKSGLVKIKVYDLLGRIIATLVNENKPVGYYSVQLNASKLTSGVYFYRMESGSFSQTKKLLLLK